MKKTLLFFTLALLVVGIMVSCAFGYTAKTYKVIYDYGYEYGDKPVIITRVFADGSSAIPMEITRKGYDFDGWYADEKRKQHFDFSAILTEDVTLYAKWTQVLFTVTYDLNEATTGTAPDSAMQESKGASVTLAATTTATKIRDASDTTKGYAFAGWNTKEDGTGTFYSPGANYIPTADITLYAVWQGWVKLWENGPKFAEFNIGSTISDYSNANVDVSSVTSWDDPTDADKAIINALYCTANIGGYYQWGGTIDKDPGDNYLFEPNGNDDISGTGTIGTDTLGDTARLIWGSNWQMSTTSHLANLSNKNKFNQPLSEELTTWSWCDGVAHTTEGDGHMQYVPGCTIAGFKVSGLVGTDYEDNSIFLPAAGEIIHSVNINNVGVVGNYWSSTAEGYDQSRTLVIDTFDGDSYGIIENSRDRGYSVRAVLAE